MKPKHDRPDISPFGIESPAQRRRARIAQSNIMQIWRERQKAAGLWYK